MDAFKTGMATELSAASFFTKQGYTVCWPLYSQCPYDFIVEKDGTCKRIQVKTPTWVKSGKYRYLQCRLGKDKRSGNSSAAGNKYLGLVDEIIFIGQDGEGIWVFPASSLQDTSNVCLASDNPKPKVFIKSYDPSQYKVIN